MKTEIHTQIFNTKPFLRDFWGLRYWQNKMGFLIRLFWSKLKWFDLELPHILKTTKIKTVITYIPSVWVTRPTRSHLGATWAHLGPVGGAWHKFCGFEVTLRQCKYELICFRTAFFFVNNSTPNIAQKWFVWISVFRRNKRFENMILGCWDIKQKPSVIFFGTPCTVYNSVF